MAERIPALDLRCDAQRVKRLVPASSAVRGRGGAPLSGRTDCGRSAGEFGVTLADRVLGLDRVLAALAN